LATKTIKRSRSYNPPENWAKFKKEIASLLKKSNADYRTRKYLTPHFYTLPLTTNKSEYPLMSKLDKLIQSRYIGFFLMEQGRVKRKAGADTTVWMLPDPEEQR
jgi:hypothetical protein